jgi:hypothetical protein
MSNFFVPASKEPLNKSVATGAFRIRALCFESKCSQYNEVCLSFSSSTPKAESGARFARADLFRGSLPTACHPLHRQHRQTPYPQAQGGCVYPISAGNTIRQIDSANQNLPTLDAARLARKSHQNRVFAIRVRRKNHLSWSIHAVARENIHYTPATGAFWRHGRAK